MTQQVCLLSLRAGLFIVPTTIPGWIGINVLGRTGFQLQDGYSLISVKKKKTAEWCKGQKSLQKTFRYMMMKKDWSFPVRGQSMLISIVVNHENMCELVA